MNCCKVLQIFVWDILELQNLIEKFQVAWFFICYKTILFDRFGQFLYYVVIKMCAIK